MDKKPVFTVVIDGKEYDVWNLEKEHPGWNGEIKTWWLYFSDRMPDNIMPPEDSEHFHPFTKGVERHCWSIVIKEKNHSKIKWDDLRINSSVWCEMYCNNKLIYEFAAGDFDFAMAKAQHLKVILMEHPYNFFNPQENEGRRIFWYGLPALVKVKTASWEILIVPDYEDGLDKEAWWKEYRRRKSKIGAYNHEFDDIENEELDEDERDGYINWGDALSDKHIDWFREGPNKPVDPYASTSQKEP